MAFLAVQFQSVACSVAYYFDADSATPYVANHEDYWIDQNVIIKIEPSKTDQYGRLWYGWDDFAQGGVNEHGLFFDGAVTPESTIPDGYGPPRGNLGDRILANCKTVQEALDFLETERVALKDSHVMFGDRTGNAVVVEWLESNRSLTWISNGKLIMTNFHLGETRKQASGCPRYRSIDSRIDHLLRSGKTTSLLAVGNTLGGAARIPIESAGGRLVGTLYSTFIDLKKMKLVYVLVASKVNDTREGREGGGR